MPIRKNKFVSGCYYHIYNRGNAKRIIFHDMHDYVRFTELLYIANTTENFKTEWQDADVFSKAQSQPLVAIGAYCLMPNHFHLLITPITENGISEFMLKLCTAYVTYFNHKYQLSGSLFEGRFKSIYVDADRYMKYLFSYIHLNPLKLLDRDWKIKTWNSTMILDFLERYDYSSFHTYLGRKEHSSAHIINRSTFPNYFPTEQEFLKELTSWFKLNDYYNRPGLTDPACKN